MHPFVVVSFRKVFRTRVRRSRCSSSCSTVVQVLWRRASFDVAKLLADSPKKDERTGLYPEEEDGKRSMTTFELPLQTAKEMPWESKHNPIITFRYGCMSFPRRLALTPLP